MKKESIERFSIVAKCQYKNHKEFYFYTSEMVVNSYDEIELLAKESVLKEWSLISPYPPPEIVDYVFGYLTLVEMETV